MQSSILMIPIQKGVDKQPHTGLAHTCAGGGWCCRRPRTELEERSPHRPRPRAGHCAQQKLSAPMCSTKVLLLPPQRVPSARPMHAALLWSGAACLLIRRDLNPDKKDGEAKNASKTGAVGCGDRMLGDLHTFLCCQCGALARRSRAVCVYLGLSI